MQADPARRISARVDLAARRRRRGAPPASTEAAAARALRKHRAAYRWSLTGAILFLGWFLSWIALVIPVNSLIATARDTSPGALPSLCLGAPDRAPPRRLTARGRGSLRAERCEPRAG